MIEVLVDHAFKGIFKGIFRMDDRNIPRHGLTYSRVHSLRAGDRAYIMLEKMALINKGIEAVKAYLAHPKVPSSASV